MMRVSLQDPGGGFLLKDFRLVVFAASLFLFQLANASVLPLAGEILVRKSQTHSSLVISALIIVPQIIVALMAPWVGRQAQELGPPSASAYRVCGFADPRAGFCAHQRSVASPRRSSPRRHQCNRTRGSDRPGHCRPDGRYRTFQLGAGHCWNSIRHWRLNQHSAIRTGCREAWPERSVFVYRRHRGARNTHDLVSDAGDKTTD